MARTGKQFLESFQSQDEALHMNNKKEPEKESSERIFSDAKYERKLVRAPAANLKVLHRLKQTHSDVCSSSK